MHTCAVPAKALDGWLKEYPSVKGNYGHLLLEQKTAIDDDLVDALRPYFESAHLDARQHFHELAGMSVHPDASDPAFHARYPDCLQETPKRGLFGEVMAGMLTEKYKFVGGHKWRIPIFLFRHHEDVERYMFALSRDPSRQRMVWGRFGTDFIAISIDKQGAVTRYIAGEAKWRKTLTEGVVDDLMLGTKSKDADGNQVRSGGIWDHVNVDVQTPHGLRQLQRLLRLHDEDGWAGTIVSLDEALLASGGKVLPRTNLILLSGNSPASRKAGYALLDWEARPGEYTAPHDLQVVELLLTDGEQLIDALYSSLWKDE
jgi:hypothetical protein